MAKAHILTRNGPSARVVFHIAVPSVGNNLANVQWQAALKNSDLVSVSALLPGTGAGGTINSAESADLSNGVLIEVIRDVPIPGGLSGAALDAFMDSHHAALTTEIQADIQARLAYFGYTRT